MILFMRKIRQRLVANSKFTKYLVYVIGEIILIVIGILIALSIDNWNSKRIANNTEVAILKEMKNNLNIDLNDIRLNIDLNKQSLHANTLVLESLTNPESNIDSLSYCYANLTLTTMLDINNTSYENLKSFGFHLIKNDSLRIKITELYTVTYVFLSNMENVIYSIQSDKITPLILKNITTEIPFVSAGPVDRKALEKNHEFIESIKYSRQWFAFMVGLYEDAEQEILALMVQIDNEIGHRTG
jgi:hypothetical protein